MSFFNTEFLRFKAGRILNRLAAIYNSCSQVFLKKRLLPERVQIETTNICNASCIFCAYQFYKAKKQTMTFATLNRVVDEVKSLGIKNVDLTPFAGEILTDHEILKKIALIKTCNPQRLLTYSNLIDMRHADADALLHCGITDLHISSAPLEKELFCRIFRNRNYEQYLQNLEMLLRRFHEVQTKTLKHIAIEFRSTMPLEKCLELPDFRDRIATLAGAGVSVSAITVFDSWMGVIKPGDLLDGMTIARPNGKKLIPCTRLNSVQIMANGDMRICGCRFNHRSATDIFFIGNIHDISILDAYNSPQALAVKRRFLTLQAPSECRKCSMYY
jgi:hypothetical protein